MLIVYVVFYLAANLPILFMTHRLHLAAPPEMYVTRIAIHLGGMVAYGLYRAMGFHPFFRPSYRKWLETTPWTWRKPLPVGPVRLGWEDLVLAAAAGLPEWLSGMLHPLATFSMMVGAI